VTTLGSLRRGAAVNLEVDLIARYVERLLSARLVPPGLTLEGLARAGYLDHKP
jgi:riboflavin synthase